MTTRGEEAPDTDRGGDILDSELAGQAAVRGGVLRVLGYALGVLFTVGSAALLLRHLGVEDSGRYATVLALTSMVAGVTEVGLTTIGLRELAVREEAAKRSLMRNLLGLRIAVTAVGIAAAVGFATLAGYDGTMVAGTTLAGFGVMILAVQGTLGISLSVKLQLGWVTVLELCRQIVLALGIVALVLAGASLLPFLAMQLPAAIVPLILTAWVVRRHTPLLPAFHPQEWRALIAEILPFAAATIVIGVYFRAAIIVLDLVSTPTETGYFGASFRVTEVLLAVPGLVVGTAFPIMARAARDDRQRLAYGVDRVFQASAVLGGALLVGLVIGAPFIIDIVGGADFAPSADVLRIQAGAVALSFSSAVLSYALLSLHMYRALLLIASTALGVVVVLVSILGASMGANGAALGALIGELAATLVALGVLWREHPAIVPSLGVLWRLPVAVAPALALLLVPGLPSFVAAALGVSIYAAAAFVVRAVPAELLDALRHR